VLVVLGLPVILRVPVERVPAPAPTPEPVTEATWQVLIPTLREDDSELWVTWNPKRKGSATDKRFANPTDPLYKIVEINWRDNARFPEVLNRQRLRDEKDRPDEYGHIWEGEYAKVIKGAYFARGLLEAKQQGRITVVPVDPLLQIRAYCDIGGTGQRADAFSIWIVQFVGLQVRVLDYYEAVGQELTEHVHWLRANGYKRALVVLPHDGRQHEKTRRVTYESALKDAGFDVKVLENIGEGAAMVRVKAAQRLMPSMWFDEKKTESGRAALAWYHEKWDEKRDIGLGPDHDWSSHCADAFGYMALDYEPPRKYEEINYSNAGIY
jgi:phage terminase large subunit